MEPQKLAELMDGSISYAFTIVDKNGKPYVGLHGALDGVIVGIGTILMKLSENHNIPLEELGDMLNMAVEELQKGQSMN